MPGPKPKPTRLKVVQGTLRANRAIANEPQPEGEIGAAPTYLNAAQRRLWEEVKGQAPAGLLTQVDRHCFEGYIVLLAARATAIRGWNVKTRNQIMVRSPVQASRNYVNPYLKQIKSLTEQLRTLEGEFGFTPAARTRISISSGRSAVDDPLLRKYMKAG